MQNDDDKLQSEHRSLTRRLLLLAAAMFGFGFLLVPLYDVFCEITGFGGRTNTTAVTVEEAPDFSREIRVEFVTTVNSY
ncbi:MAG: cytochrome c oxidase assembly protein, partial [Woeseiaceae bacterium]|nr:cytochrome c oxidase assembly protein [Woeseiaceae bacterium]